MIPELERHCGSWIAMSPDGASWLECFDRDDAEKLDSIGWRVLTAAQHLSAISIAEAPQ